MLDVDALAVTGADRCALPLTPHQAFYGNALVLPLLLLVGVALLPFVSANCSAVVHRRCCLWMSRRYQRCFPSRRPRDYSQPMGDSATENHPAGITTMEMEALYSREPAPERDT